MASPRHRTTIENLPHEVLSEIFIRLLAKQLAQMRCVCKPWNAFLSESSFVKSHLHHSTHNNDEIFLFFKWGFSFDYDQFTACLSHSPYLELDNFIKSPVIPQHKSSWGRFIGSVNGLICFSYGLKDDPVIYIWNPSLSAVLTLPTSSFPSCHFLVGFGFDPKTDDYKVFKEGEVYSMRKGSWDLISQQRPFHIRMFKGLNITCVDGLVGHLHWLGYLGTTGLEVEQGKILAFDLGAETFREIPPPDSILHHQRIRENVLGVLGGKLCVMLGVRDGGCEVWLMNEYGVADSWIKHHAFSQISGVISPYGFTSRNEFLYQFDVDDDHFGVYDHFGLYDPIAAKTKTFVVMGISITSITKVVEYVDSLVWVGPAERDRSISQFKFLMGVRGIRLRQHNHYYA